MSMGTRMCGTCGQKPADTAGNIYHESWCPGFAPPVTPFVSLTPLPSPRPLSPEEAALREAVEVIDAYPMEIHHPNSTLEARNAERALDVDRLYLATRALVAAWKKEGR